MTAATQTVHPWRAVVRTSIQVGIPVLIALGIIVPEAVSIVLEEVGARTTVPDWLRVSLLGTAAVVTPIGKLVSDDFTIDHGEEPGEITMSLRKTLLDIQYGRAEDTNGWLYKLADG